MSSWPGALSAPISLFFVLFFFAIKKKIASHCQCPGASEENGWIIFTLKHCLENSKGVSCLMPLNFCYPASFAAHSPWAATIPQCLNLLVFGVVEPPARRVLGFSKVQGTAGAGMNGGELQEQQTMVFAMGGGLYLIYFIFLVPFEAALKEWLALV